jgi:hypothetical protein
MSGSTVSTRSTEIRKKEARSQLFRVNSHVLKNAYRLHLDKIKSRKEAYYYNENKQMFSCRNANSFND